jgi:hypothetical protein
VIHRPPSSAARSFSNKYFKSVDLILQNLHDMTNIHATKQDNNVNCAIKFGVGI